MNLKGKDFISLTDFSADEILYLLNYAQELKDQSKNGVLTPVLKDKNLLLIF